MRRFIYVTAATTIIASLSLAWRAQDLAAIAAFNSTRNRIENCYQTAMLRQLLGDRAGPIPESHRALCDGLEFPLQTEKGK